MPAKTGDSCEGKYYLHKIFSFNNWAMQNMSLAIDANTSNACSKIQAAVNFGVPKATLRRYLKKSYNNKCRGTSIAGDILTKKTTHCYLMCDRFRFKAKTIEFQFLLQKVVC